MRKNNEVKAWVYKAEQDFEGACILARKRKKPVPDLVCFHCHQAAEKFLKGYLVGENVPFPKTHDLTSLEMLVSGKLPGNSGFFASILYRTAVTAGVLILAF